MPLDGGKTIEPQPLMGYYSKINWADADGDGLKDLLVGQTCNNKNHIVMYRNVGTVDKPELAKPKEMALPNNSTSRPSPCMADLDGDGRPDMICGTDGKDILFFKNTGKDKKPKWKKPEKLALKGKGYLVKGGFSSPAVRNCIRITLGGPDVMQGFVHALRAVMSELDSDYDCG